MECSIPGTTPESIPLLRRAAAGARGALDALFATHQKRLKQMIRLRLSPRLRGRVDASDVFQDACLDAARRIDEYLRQPEAPFFLWLRQITGQRLIDVHRRHLGAGRRDAGREVCLHGGSLPAATSESLAAQLLGHLTTPSQAAVKAEMRTRLQDVLNGMDPVDREVLALRHFEHLDNAETARTLGISESGASSRYVRALRRLRSALTGAPGFRDEAI